MFWKARSSDVNVQRLVPILLVVVSILLATGCSYPKTSVMATEENSALVFKGSPPTARVRIDGIEAGLADDYSGERSLGVIPGRHVVEVVDNGRVLLREDVFLSAGSIKTLSVSTTEQ
jgi:hypothetical protein